MDTGEVDTAPLVEEDPLGEGEAAPLVATKVPRLCPEVPGRRDQQGQFGLRV